KNSGGEWAEHFEIVGQIPEGYELYFTIEQYENGKFIQNHPPPNPVNLDTKDRAVSFAVITDSEKGKILFGHPSGVTTQEMKTLQGGSSSAKTFEGKIPVKTDKPVYLAYWYTGSSDILKGTDGDLEDIKSRDLSYLFKAELKEK
ncbi:hypothetical protein J4G37_38175, partial [Microvirga sp. 3-52]|nr:hypothetical protein [Microvirga sp. 3-52]